MNSFRRPSILLLAGIALAVSIAVIAFLNRIPNEQEQETAILSSEAPAQCYSEAVSLLAAGGSTRRAIALLDRSLREEPNNPSYHEALACADTARAAVVYRALFFELYIQQQRSAYVGEMWQWSIDRFDKGADDYKAPMPKEQPYHDIHYKDDGARYNLNEDQSVETILSLYRSAQNESTLAEKESLSTNQLALFDYEDAWIIRIFYTMKPGPSDDPYSDAVTDSIIGRPSELPDIYEAVHKIQQACAECPTNPIYWQTQGELLDIASPDNSNEYAYFKKPAPPVPASRPSYIRSLQLQPENQDLLLQLGLHDIWRNRSSALSFLQRAVNTGSKNSYALLLYAAALLGSSHYDQNAANSASTDKAAVDAAMMASLTTSDRQAGHAAEQLLAQAADCDLYREPSIRPTTPRLLQAASTNAAIFPTYEYHQFAILRNMARDVTGLAYGDAVTGHVQEADTLYLNLAKSVDPMCSPSYFTRAALHDDTMIRGLVGLAIKSIALNGRDKLIAKFGAKSERAAADKDWITYKAQETLVKLKALNLQTDDLFVHY